MGKHNTCSRCLIDMSKERDKAIEVCECGHGMVHHDGEFGDCTCPLTWKDTKCKCQEFKLAWGIWNHVRMTAKEYCSRLSSNSKVI